MKEKLIALAVVFTTLFITTAGMFLKFNTDIWITFSITFGTFAYHFVMRLIVGYAVNGIFHNCMNHKRKWFEPKAFEEGLYKRLKVKRWKKYMPTYDAAIFSKEKHTVEEIAGGMCQAEIVHEIIVILSFAPIILSLKWGAFWVFVITSVLAAGFDTCFVIMQRYNRPRLINIMEKDNERRKER